MSNNTDTISEACTSIDRGDLASAKSLIGTKYPFQSMENSGRKYSDLQKSRIFFRDGFIDRYSGEKLIFPGALRLLSRLMPEEFPYHPNWKTSECHIAYWQLFPTIDHVVPVSRGGIDEEPNWVCTSQLRNSAKSNWLMEELGWTIFDPGTLSEWDGQTKWFVNYVDQHIELLNDNYLKSWHKAGEICLNET